MSFQFFLQRNQLALEMACCYLFFSFLLPIGQALKPYLGEAADAGTCSGPHHSGRRIYTGDPFDGHHLAARGVPRLPGPRRRRFFPVGIARAGSGAPRPWVSFATMLIITTEVS